MIRIPTCSAAVIAALCALGTFAIPGARAQDLGDDDTLEAESGDDDLLGDDGSEPPADDEGLGAEGEVGAEGEAGGSFSLGGGAEGEAAADTEGGAEGEAVAEMEMVDDTALEPMPAGADEEIVVTGSRVKRSIFTASASIQKIDRAEIEKSGAQSVGDLVQNMTVASGSGYDGGGGGPGTTQINLRGLGAGATLVLVNGRRVAPSAAGITVNFVDVGTIPLAAVERIEILKGGASAIYGSDAIAGVVNIITRNDWEGLRVQLDGRGTTKSFDYRQGVASIAMGASADRARVTGAVSYRRNNQLTADKRDFTSNEGPPGGQGGNWSLGGQPGTYIAGGLMPDPNCLDATDTRLDTLPGIGQLCSFSFNRYRALTLNEENTALYVHGEYDVTDHTKLFLEANASKARTDYVGSPSYSFTIRPVVPADHRDNPFGMPATFIGRPLGGAYPGVVNGTDDDTLRTAFGLKGDLLGAAADTAFEDWTWELFATFGVSRYQRFLPDTVFTDFLESLNSCSDASDLSNCFNPFHSAVLGTGTPNADEVIDSFTGALMTTVDQHLQTYTGGIAGDLFELPGGDLGFAIGGELRQEQRSSQLDHDTNQFDLSFYFGDDDAVAERDVVAGYLELVWPFYNGFEIQTAGRVENYSDAGLTANPTIGLVMIPGEMAGSDSQAFRSLVLRAYVSRAFRAPGLYQSFNGSTTVPASLDDGGPSPIFRPIRRTGNPDLEPEEALAITAGVDWAPVKELNLSLEYWRFAYQGYITPENAQKILSDERAMRMMDMNFVDPRVARDESGSLQRITVTHVNIPGDIVTHGIDAGANVRLDAGSGGTFSFGANGTYVIAYDIPRSQIAEIRIPANMMTGAPAGMASLPFCDVDSCNVAGHLNEANIAGPQPSLRFNVPIGWSLDSHALTATAHFISSLEDWAPSRFDTTTFQARSVDSFLTIDAQYALTLDEFIGEMTQLRIGVLNLLDQPPPFADLLDSYVAALHDPRGRMVYASLTQEF